jgi:hypothetical protein
VQTWGLRTLVRAANYIETTTSSQTKCLNREGMNLVPQVCYLVVDPCGLGGPLAGDSEDFRACDYCLQELEYLHPVLLIVYSFTVWDYILNIPLAFPMCMHCGSSWPLQAGRMASTEPMGPGGPKLGRRPWVDREILHVRGIEMSIKKKRGDTEVNTKEDEQKNSWLRLRKEGGRMIKGRKKDESSL